MTFGQRFKELRIQKGLKQQELVDDFNKIYGYTFTKSAISQYENDKRKPETEALRDFALYFNVSLDYLLCINEDRDINIDIKDKFLDFVEEFFKNKDVSRDEKDKLFKELSTLYFDSLK